MSKAFFATRTSFTCCVAALLLFLQPATLVLHVGCHHAPAGNSKTAGVSFVAAVQHWCSHHGCTHHDLVSSKGSQRSADRSTPTPVPSEPHHSDECQICQTVFAARMSLPLAQCPVSTGIVVVLPDRFVPEAFADRQYRLPDRGPPSSEWFEQSASA
jgi:hypothetical protein